MQIQLDHLSLDAFKRNPTVTPANLKKLPRDWLNQLVQFFATAINLSSAEKKDLQKQMIKHQDSRKLYHLNEEYMLIYRRWSDNEPPLPVEEKREIAHVLNSVRNLCPEGFHNQVSNIIASFSFTPNLTGFLEKIRENIVEIAVDENVLRDGSHVHGHNHFFNAANTLGFGIRPGNVDFYTGHTKAGDTLLKDDINLALETAFVDKYRVPTILSELLVVIKSFLGKDLDYKGKHKGLQNTCGMLRWPRVPTWQELQNQDAVVLVGEDIYLCNHESQTIAKVNPGAGSFLRLKNSFSAMYRYHQADADELELISAATPRVANNVYKYGDIELFQDRFLKHLFVGEENYYDFFLTDEDGNVIDFNWVLIKQKLVQQLLAKNCFALSPAEQACVHFLSGRPLPDYERNPQLDVLFTGGLIKTHADFVTVWTYFEDSYETDPPLSLYTDLISGFIRCMPREVDKPLLLAKLMKSFAEKQPDLALAIIKKTRAVLATIDARDASGKTPLILAAEAGNVADLDTLLYLFKNTIDAVDNRKNTALCRAVYYGDKTILEHLLAKGAQQLQRNSYGHNVLDYAISLGRPNLVEMLLLNAVCLECIEQEELLSSVQGGPYETVFDYALSKGNIPLLWKLIDACPEGHLLPFSTSKRLSEYKIDNSSTLLHLAVSSGDQKVVQFFLQAGVSPDQTNRAGESVLERAVALQSYRIAELLLSYGASTKKQPKTRPLLLIATEKQDRPMVQLLLNNGAMLEEKDGNNDTALNWAIRGGSEDIAWLLIKHGASVTGQKNKWKQNALDIAMKQEKPIVPLPLKLLLASKLSTSEQKKWLMKNMGINSVDILSFVKTHRPDFLPDFLGGPVNSNVMSHLRAINFEPVMEALADELTQLSNRSPTKAALQKLIRQLTKAKMDFICSGLGVIQPVFFQTTCEEAVLNALEALIPSLSFEPILYNFLNSKLIRDKISATHLINAVKENDLEKVTDILESNPDCIDVMDQSKNTALHWAVSRIFNRNTKIIDVLIKHGASVEKENSLHENALEMAEETTAPAPTQLLLASKLSIEKQITWLANQSYKGFDSVLHFAAVYYTDDLPNLLTTPIDPAVLSCLEDCHFDIRLNLLLATVDAGNAALSVLTKQLATAKLDFISSKDSDAFKTTCINAVLESLEALTDNLDIKAILYPFFESKRIQDKINAIDLIKAVRGGNLANVQLLAKLTDSLDIPDITGNNALTWAILNRDKIAARLLIKQGASVTPEMLAIAESNKETASFTLLLASKLSIEQQQAWLAQKTVGDYDSVLSYATVHYLNELPSLVAIAPIIAGHLTTLKFDTTLLALKAEGDKLPNKSLEKHAVHEFILQLAKAKTDLLSSPDPLVRNKPAAFDRACMNAVDAVIGKIEKNPKIRTIIWAFLCDIACSILGRTTNNRSDCGFFSKPERPLNQEIKKLKDRLREPVDAPPLAMMPI